MSTLNVDNLKTLSGNGIDAEIVSIGGGQLSNRNKIINGAMMISQRATSKTDAAAGYHTVDRMRMSKNSLVTAEMRHEQSTDSPNGFGKSVKITTTTAEGSVGVDDAFRPVQYRFEGQDLQDLAYGTSDAKTLTLSFYVKSSVTGTYSVSFRNITAGTYRLRSTTYTIDSANTWEKKIITIAGDTSTAIIDDNATRFEIYWCGGSGTNFTSSNVAASGWADYVSGGLHHGHTVQLQNTLNSTFLLTGIQLEVGSIATSFEHRSFGDELHRCKRYFQIIADGRDNANEVFGVAHAWNSVQAEVSLRWDVEMRATPTLEQGVGTNYYQVLINSVNKYTNQWLEYRFTRRSGMLYNTNFTGLGGGNAYRVKLSDASAYLHLNAEL
jgi:hypothetical protein